VTWVHVSCLQDEARRAESMRREAERNRHRDEREKEKELELIRKQYLVRSGRSNCAYVRCCNWHFAKHRHGTQ
jgi:hypothetical protein